MVKLCTNISLVMIAMATFTACVGSPRSGTVSSATPPAAPLTQEPTEKQLASEQSAVDDRGSTQVQTQPALPARNEAFATAPPESKAQAPAAAPAGRRDRKEARGAPASPSRASPSDEESSPHDLLQDALRPTPADSPMLRAALQDLIYAAQELSAGHSCEEGCRAYQSMQRAAGKICELAPRHDPSQRCTSAQARVSTADEELRRRCGTCPRLTNP